VYHCHLLEHEDGGMMGTIRVERDSHNDQLPATQPH
jgi:Multicopper oxidase